MATTEDTTGRTTRLETPLATKSYIDALLNRTRQRENVLGDLCRFEISGVEIDPVTLTALLKKYNLENWRPVTIRAKSAARKAITRIRPKLEDPENDLRVIVRPVHTDEPEVTRYAIVNEATDRARQDLDFSTWNQVVFRSDLGTMEFTGTPVQEIIDEFNYLCSVYTDRELKLMINNIIEKHGVIHMADNTGMFFMPHTHKPMVDSLVSLVDDMKNASNSTPTLCYFRPIAIMDDAKNRAIMGDALVAELVSGLDEAKHMLEDSMGSESSRKRKIGMAAALKKFSEAQGKARLYKDMLQVNLEAIEARIQEAQTQASTIINDTVMSD